ncbi:hypothetical protein [Thalassospira permensis]|uniref:Uncharacterized protein n=1 Tax=Thalassospira permensis NBRC 106175 TaxID=1353532 RepID=A0ABR4TPJ2_9PROT|nr:hypothetical protein [Thalassospira permensis]KEO56978.1 hypothetical protein SMB34_17615 [Thalassospira permensis NBRC 106175]
MKSIQKIFSLPVRFARNTMDELKFIHSVYFRNDSEYTSEARRKAAENWEPLFLAFSESVSRMRQWITKGLSAGAIASFTLLTTHFLGSEWAERLLYVFLFFLTGLVLQFIQQAFMLYRSLWQAMKDTVITLKGLGRRSNSTPILTYLVILGDVTAFYMLGSGTVRGLNLLFEVAKSTSASLQ